MDLLVYEVVMKARPMMDRLEAVFDIVPHAESIEILERTMAI